jgi:hypothetical protein
MGDDASVADRSTEKRQQHESDDDQTVKKQRFDVEQCSPAHECIDDIPATAAGYIGTLTTVPVRFAALPIVELKNKYLGSNCPVPVCASMKRIVWPEEFKGDFVQTPDFRAYIRLQLNQDACLAERACLYVGRFFGAIVVRPTAAVEDASEVVAAIDVAVLVSMYTSDLHHAWFCTRMMNPRYPWSMHILYSMILYCRFHIHRITSDDAKSDNLAWKDYTAAVVALVDDIKLEYQKRGRFHISDTIG